jgi:hypothetical protein
MPFRKGNLLVGGGWRAFFAPYNAALGNTSNNTSSGVTILDLQVQGPFNEYALPGNFVDLGWITKFKITPASKIGAVRSGYRGAIRAMYRGEVGETVEFTVREATRLAWKVATGTEIFNLMNNPAAAASTVGPLSSSGSTAVPIGASGYVPGGLTGVTYSQGVPTLCVPAGSGAAFPAGSYIVCDQDYQLGQYGIVGAAGINIFQNAVTDVDFIRKTSDFVARVVCVIPNAVAGQDALVLNNRFVGGGNQASAACAASGSIPYGPTAGAKVQLIKGFLAREGGSYITEWSGLFCMDTIDGSQVAIYYPHLAPNQFRDIASWQIENIGTTDLTGYELDTVLQSLAYDDPLDGETVVRYAAYYPAPNLDLQN